MASRLIRAGSWTPVEMLWTFLFLCGYLPGLPVLTTIISWLDDCNGFLLEGHMAPVSPSHRSLGALGPCPGSGIHDLGLVLVSPAS